MTEQQIKRIQEAVNTPDTAIQCETKEEAWMLFEAMGWRWIPAEVIWLGSDRAYFGAPSREKGWNRDFARAFTGKVVPFSTLLTPEPCGLVKALGLELERKYQYNQTVFWFTEKQFHIETGGSFGIGSAALLIELFNNPHEIRPARVWGEDSTERVKALLECGLDSIRRTAGSCGGLYVSDGVSEVRLLSRLFPELQPGECVALADIAGG